MKTYIYSDGVSNQLVVSNGKVEAVILSKVISREKEGFFDYVADTLLNIALKTPDTLREISDELTMDKTSRDLATAVISEAKEKGIISEVISLDDDVNLIVEMGFVTSIMKGNEDFGVEYPRYSKHFEGELKRILKELKKSNKRKYAQVRIIAHDDRFVQEV